MVINNLAYLLVARASAWAYSQPRWLALDIGLGFGAGLYAIFYRIKALSSGKFFAAFRGLLDVVLHLHLSLFCFICWVGVLKLQAVQCRV